MTNIFDALKDSHQKQRLLIDALLKTSGDSHTRREFYQQLKTELKDHAIAEERFFYKPLIESDQTIDLTRHGIAEHHAIDKVLAELDDTPFDSPAWLTLMKTLEHKVSHHLEEEELRFFQVAGKALSERQKTSLAKKYEQHRDR
ncbi:hemerythrin domain-containing protein [Thalassotalea ponticola]|uniref:hemerythrin domain-containing protein n=1 Tax=Thalassotalea ponticola TaxID=1523392 RepID=UPI0025B53F54|nr:hemerythrin domain-containing protein [Thalassotalea ponticola]MDN3653547.1 hemerythrin domain-containing protein [Thalassotalea ponticola]